MVWLKVCQKPGEIVRYERILNHLLTRLILSGDEVPEGVETVRSPLPGVLASIKYSPTSGHGRGCSDSDEWQAFARFCGPTPQPSPSDRLFPRLGLPELLFILNLGAMLFGSQCWPESGNNCNDPKYRIRFKPQPRAVESAISDSGIGN
jgi:hypothetical protein